MRSDRPALKELTALWKQRLRQAEENLASARAQVRERREELRSRQIPSPDAHYAYQRALRAETLALEKYANVLIIFNDLVLHGTKPDDEESGAA